MSWIIIALVAYFILAFESVANKFLIVGKVKSWRLYLFFIGLLSSTGFVFIPWGFVWPNGKVASLGIFSGVVFFGYLAVMFSSLKKWSASRVFVLMGAVTTLVTVLLARIFLGEELTGFDFLGIALLIVGSFFISYRYQKKRLFGGYKWATLAGALLAISFVILKAAFDAHAGHNFVTVYVLSRVGIVGTSILILLLPHYRKRVFYLLKKRKNKRNAANFGWTFLVKVLGGIAAVMVNYAVAVGSVSIVNALAATQYFFIFVLSLFLGFYLKEFSENLDRKNVLIKTAGVVFIVAGIVLVMI